MDFRKIFGVFSRRRSQAENPLPAITSTFRNRVLILCNERLSDQDTSFYIREDNRPLFWREIHTKFTYLLGTVPLSPEKNSTSEIEDAINFVGSCSDEHFLDFVEFICQIECFRRALRGESQLVDEINEFLQIDDIPYALTPFVREETLESHFGRESGVSTIVSWPTVVCRDNQVTYAEAILPSIELLADQKMTSANREFLSALEDYRRGNLGDCLTKCGSSFESTMKIICARRGWSYTETDTAAKLLRTVLTESQIEPFFEQPLMVIATMRNKLSSSHGAGNQQRLVSKQTARFAINSTAAAILFLTEECL